METTQLVWAFLLCGVSVIVTFAWHYWALGRLYRIMPQEPERMTHFLHGLSILLLLMLVHVVELLWFTGGYYVAHQVLDLGDFTEQFVPGFRDYFYFSTVTYTTLGLSEFTPTGQIKIIAGMQSLTGFIVLTWSAGFFYSLISRNDP